MSKFAAYVTGWGVLADSELLKLKTNQYDHLSINATEGVVVTLTWTSLYVGMVKVPNADTFRKASQVSLVAGPLKNVLALQEDWHTIF